MMEKRDKVGDKNRSEVDRKQREKDKEQRKYSDVVKCWNKAE